MINLFKRLEELRGLDPCGIYHLKINNISYIGSSFNIKKRLRRHRFLLKKNIHDNKYLQNLYNKYKTCEYEIIEEIPSTITNLSLRQKEKDWINKFKNTCNIGDPIKGIGGTIEKEVYQYNKEGHLLKKWSSVMLAARKLKLNYAPLHACANPNVKVSKSAYGFIWSYKPLKDHKYVCNTGENLKKREVHLYLLNGTYFESFDSLSNCARFIADYCNYTKDWKNIRSAVGYCLKKPKTRSIKQKFKVSYNKESDFNKALSTGS